MQPYTCLQNAVKKDQGGEIMNPQLKQQKLFLYTQPTFYQKKLEELRNTEKCVAWLLHHNAHLRNCDKCLVKAFEIQVDKYDGNLNREVIHRLTPKESITRCRRKLNEIGLFLPTEDTVMELRNVAEHVVREWSLAQ